jgi:hypothetical protein
MLMEPPPQGANTGGYAYPRTGQQVSGINYQQPQQFTLPGAQGQGILDRNTLGALQSNPISAQPTNNSPTGNSPVGGSQPPHSMFPQQAPQQSSGSVDMAHALMQNKY